MKKIMCTLAALLLCSVATTAFGAGILDPTEESDLVFMREEEKMARDVYLALNQTWGHRVFSNISESEQRHMDAMLKMLELFDIPDPIGSNAHGIFNDATLGSLYEESVSNGSVSLLEAFRAGAYVEETDIQGLKAAIANTDEASLLKSYGNLLAGSHNHLRTFVAHIQNLGFEYDPAILSDEDYSAIVGDFEGLPVSASGFTMNAGLNDAWYYPETDGQGFVVTVFPGIKKVFLVWFTYDAEFPAEDVSALLGNPGQRWLTAQGGFSGSLADLEVYSLANGLFDSGSSVPEPEPQGSIMLQFENCNSGSVTYEILTSAGSLKGFVPIQRVNSDNVAKCEQNTGAGNASDGG